jgi:hypothetical protein
MTNPTRKSKAPATYAEQLRRIRAKRLPNIRSEIQELEEVIVQLESFPDRNAEENARLEGAKRVLSIRKEAIDGIKSPEEKLLLEIGLSPEIAKRIAARVENERRRNQIT